MQKYCFWSAHYPAMLPLPLPCPAAQNDVWRGDMGKWPSDFVAAFSAYDIDGIVPTEKSILGILCWHLRCRKQGRRTERFTDRESWPTGNGASQDVDLMAQGNNLNLELVPSSQTETDGREQGKQSAEHESRANQPYPGGAIFSIKTEFLAGTSPHIPRYSSIASFHGNTSTPSAIRLRSSAMDATMRRTLGKRSLKQRIAAGFI
jgi:hypothetical protein